MQETVRKCPLHRAELSALRDQYLSSDSHDDLLFFVILLVGFHALMWLGELVWPDKKALQDYQKVKKCSTVKLLPEGFSFFLPGHKADRFFEGNRIIVLRYASGDDPDVPFRKYLASCDKLFPFHPELWLHADGSIPTRGWFIHRLRQHFPPMWQVTLYVQAGPGLLRKLAYHHTLSRPLAVGLPTPSKFIFANTCLTSCIPVWPSWCII